MKLDKIRKEIDKVDYDIIRLLGRRMALVREIAKIKKTLNLPIADESREKELLERLRKKAKETNLDEDLVTSLYEIILNNSRKEQDHLV